MSKPTVFNFKYDTNHVEEQLPVLTEELSDDMLAAFESKIACFTNTLEEASTSRVRSGFDSKAHFDKLMDHPLFKLNHLSYGLKSAQKRKDKGTFDSELNQKMGQNLAKIGASRIGEKYNSAEQREVGKHIASHIEAHVNSVKEEVEQIDEVSAAAMGRAADHEYANQAKPASSGNTAIKVQKVQVKKEPTKHHVETKGMFGTKRVATYSSSMAAAAHAKRVGGKVVSEGYETDAEYLEEVKKLPDWAQSVFDEYKTKASKGAAMSDNSEVSKFNPKVDGHYKVQKFAKGKVNKGSYGTAANADEDEVPVKQKDVKFDVPNVWGTQAAPKAAPKVGKLVSFNDKSHKDTHATAGAVHGPNSNHADAQVGTPHSLLTVQMVTGKGFAVVDSQGQVVTGKTGKELSGYRKKGAAQMALRDHMREDVDVVLTLSLSEMYSLIESDNSSELEWVVEVIKENNVHHFFILDEADVIAEGTNLTLEGAVKLAYRKALQLEEYISGKIDQPARIMEIVKSTINK